MAGIYFANNKHEFMEVDINMYILCQSSSDYFYLAHTHAQFPFEEKCNRVLPNKIHLRKVGLLQMESDAYFQNNN